MNDMLKGTVISTETFDKLTLGCEKILGEYEEIKRQERKIKAEMIGSVALIAGIIFAVVAKKML